MLTREQAEIEAIAWVLLTERGIEDLDPGTVASASVECELERVRAAEQSALLSQAAELASVARHPRRALIGPPAHPEVLKSWRRGLRSELLQVRSEGGPLARELLACAFGHPASWPVETGGRLARRALALDGHPAARLALARARLAQGHSVPAGSELERVVAALELRRECRRTPALRLRAATTEAALMEAGGDLPGALLRAEAGGRLRISGPYWALIGVALGAALEQLPAARRCLARLHSHARMDQEGLRAREVEREVDAALDDLRRRAPAWDRIDPLRRGLRQLVQEVDAGARAWPLMEQLASLL